MRPYGVWAVIAPFNYPSALVAGPAGAALVAGNAVIIKPSPIGSLSGHLVFDASSRPGVPRGAVNVLTGAPTPARRSSRTPVSTASRSPGRAPWGCRSSARSRSSQPKPAICEMGGKNPVIVTAAADLELAAAGTARSAFSYAGQKCSAASRVFVDADGRRRVRRPARRAGRGDRTGRDRSNQAAFSRRSSTGRARSLRHDRRRGAARKARCCAAAGASTDGDLAAGNFVAPTVVLAPDDSTVWTDELFVPLIAVRSVASLDEALRPGERRAVRADRRLVQRATTTEIERFLGGIEAGVVYVNRAAGATTGAWPGVQPFGGWKRSGTAGKAGGGPYYLQQYLREQSRTVVET